MNKKEKKQIELPSPEKLIELEKLISTDLGKKFDYEGFVKKLFDLKRQLLATIHINEYIEYDLQRLDLMNQMYKDRKEFLRLKEAEEWDKHYRKFMKGFEAS